MIVPIYKKILWLYFYSMRLNCSARTWSDVEQSPTASDEECGGGGAGLTAAQLLARVRALGRRGLCAEYEDIRERPPAGTFTHARYTSHELTV